MGNRLIQIAAVFVMLVAALLMVSVVTVVVLPYEPLEYEYVQPKDSEICENADAQTVVSYTLDEDLYDTIRTIEVESYWVAIDVEGLSPGTRRPGGQATLQPEQVTPGKKEGPGDLLRYTPNLPGVWQLHNDYIIRSNRPILPAAQSFSVAAQYPTTILPRDDPRCTG